MKFALHVHSLRQILESEFESMLFLKYESNKICTLPTWRLQVMKKLYGELCCLKGSPQKVHLLISILLLIIAFILFHDSRVLILAVLICSVQG